MALISLVSLLPISSNMLSTFPHLIGLQKKSWFYFFSATIASIRPWFCKAKIDWNYCLSFGLSSMILINWIRHFESYIWTVLNYIWESFTSKMTQLPLKRVLLTLIWCFDAILSTMENSPFSFFTKMSPFLLWMQNVPSIAWTYNRSICYSI